VKKIQEIKLDYNIVIMINQAHSCFDKSNLTNFFYCVRGALKYMPPYLKFIFTFIPNDNFITLEDCKIVLALRNKENFFKFNDSDIFESYSKEFEKDVKVMPETFNQIVNEIVFMKLY
jgi:hypothetical protein